MIPLLAQPRRAGSSRLMRWGLAVSLLLHLAVAGAGLTWPRLWRPTAPEVPHNLAAVEVIMGGGAEADQPVQTSAPQPPAPQPPVPPRAPHPQPSAPSAPPVPPATEPDAAGLPAQPPRAVPPPRAETPPVPQMPVPQMPAPRVQTPTEPPPKIWQQNVPLSGGLAGASGLEGRVRPAQGAEGNRPPVYPRLSADLGEQGTVVVRMHIGPDGRVRSTEILTSSGYARLDSAAREAVARWRFTPAVRDGQAVESIFDLSLTFSLN